MLASAVHYWYAWSIEEAIVIYDFRIIRICPVVINVLIRHGSGVVVVLDVGQYKTNGGIGIDIVSEGGLPSLRLVFEILVQPMPGL